MSRECRFLLLLGVFFLGAAWVFPGHGISADPPATAWNYRQVEPLSRVLIPGPFARLSARSLQIVGGHEAASGAWPSAAYIVVGSNGEAVGACTGSLIGEQWVLSAAHCFTVNDGPSPSQFLPGLGALVVLGENDLRNVHAEDIFAVEAVYIAAFEPATGRNDVALLRLARPGLLPGLRAPAAAADRELATHTTRPLRVARPDEVSQSAPGTIATIVGWGSTEHGVTPLLHQADVEVRHDTDCASIYHILVPNAGFPATAMLCTGSLSQTPGPGPHFGDSGGPLIVSDEYGNRLQAAITCFGTGTTPGVADFYTEAAAYTQQIVSVLALDPVAPIGPPTASTGDALKRRKQSAKVTGLINPNGLATHYRFDFGRTRRYGQAVSGYAGGGHHDVNVAAKLTGLRPGTKYHYRVVAMSSAGEMGSWDRIFTTAPDKRAPTVRPMRSSGRAGRTVELAFRVWDDTSSKTRERVTVRNTSRAIVAKLQKRLHPTERSTVYSVKWRAPKDLTGRLRFCVESWDTHGNKSKPGCAPLLLR